MTSEGMDEEVLTREEAKRILRRLELDAYSSVITAFRAQGDLNRDKKQALSELAAHLSISTERHRAEVRRVVNDDSLNSVAECLHGIGTAAEWSIEGRRLVSLTPRLVPQTVFIAKATHTANAISLENAKLPAKKAPLQNTRERFQTASSKISEKFEEKVKVKDSKPQELSRSLSTSSTSSSKSQESDKSKRKKKQNPPSNRLLKPNKLNLPFKSVSSPNLTKQNLASPSSMHKPISPGSRHGNFHQKPLILQRSPQKVASTSRSLSADGAGSGSHLYGTKPVLTSSSPVATGTLSYGNDASTKQLNLDSRATGQQSKSPVPSSISNVVQKMKFKTPITKSKAKPAKLKTVMGGQRPANLSVNNVSPGAESLNVLGTSTVVPMAPISPVKPVIPSGISGGMSCGTVPSGILSSGSIPSGILSGGSSTNGSSNALSGNCPVKVVQVQKATSNVSSQSSSANPGSKPFVVVSSSTPSKTGNAQRVLALGNVPISGNQQLKIASIPNVLQQSGAKIVSIAKSMPMTTGFKMIAVTTVVPGSTQVKTVYIATPIMSVTKTSTQSIHGAASNQTASTKLLQSLASSPSTIVRPAQTDVSPSNPAAVGKTAMGIVNSRGFVPAAVSSVNSIVTTTVSTSSSISHKTSASSTASVVTSTAMSKRTVTTPNIASKIVVIAKDSAEAPTLTTSVTPKETQNSEVDKLPFHTAVPLSLPNKPNCLSETETSPSKEKGSVVEKEKKISENQSKDGHKKLQTESRPSSTAVNESSNCNEESILLAGERFLADLAAKFSKNNVEIPAPKVSSDSSARLDMATREPVGPEKKAPETLSKGDTPTTDFSARIQVQHGEPNVTNSLESKVIVRKIEEEYNSPLKLSPDIENEGNDAANPSEKENQDSTGYLADESVDCNSSTLTKVSPAFREARDTLPKVDLLNHNSADTDNSSQLSSGLQINNSLESSNYGALPSKVKSLQAQTLTKDSKERKALFANDVPSNIFTTFLPANGDTEDNTTAEGESAKKVSPLIISREESPIASANAKRSSSPTQSYGVLIEQAVGKKSPSETVIPYSGQTVTPKKTALTLSPSVVKPQPLVLETSKWNLYEDGDDAVLTSKQRHTPPKNFHLVTSTNNSNSVGLNPVYTSPLNSPVRKLPLPPFEKDSYVKSPISPYPEVQHGTNTGLLQQNMQNNKESDYSHTVFTNLVPTAVVETARGSNDSLTQNSFDKVSTRSSPKTVRSRGRSSPIDLISVSESVQLIANTSNELIRQENNDKIAHVGTNSIQRGKKRKSEPSVIPVGWIKGALTLLQRVSRFRGPNKQKGEMNAASWFTRPVNPAEAPGYYKVIKKPMDFSTVRKKLEDGVYKDFTEFYSDMLLIKSNCHTYNPVDHIARKDCDLVFAFFEEESYKFLEKQQKPEDSPSKKSKVDVAV